MLYFDNAATEEIKPEVLVKMMPYLTDKFANPSALYNSARETRNAVEDARKSIAKLLRARPEEIMFTSGGSESNNWAIQSEFFTWLKVDPSKNMIITTKIEHPSVLKTCKFLQDYFGATVKYLDVYQDGSVDTELLETLLSYGRTAIVSIQMANNEIGTIQDVEEISKICNKYKATLHMDCVQAFGHIDLDVRTNMKDVDMISFSGHKIGAPKGIGGLYVKGGAKNIIPLIHGGHQEFGKRAGTENVAGIVGLGVAAKLCKDNMTQNTIVKENRDYIIEMLLSEIDNCIINGNRFYRLPNNVSVSFSGIDSESLKILLDGKGICVSSGSACTAGQHEPSHVLQAIGVPESYIDGTIRITINENTTKDEIDVLISEICRCVKLLRGE